MLSGSIPTCAILVLNYNGQDLLARHLPSVLEAARQDGHRVLVVDNDSRDRSTQVAGDLGAEVLATGANLFMLGLNRAARAVDTDVVVTLCNDVSVDPQCFRHLLESFAHPRVFAVTGKVCWVEDRKTLQLARVTGRFADGLIDPVYLLRQLEEPDAPAPRPTLYGTGGATAWRRSTFLELGGFDPLLFPLYFEDVDLSYSGWRRGWQTVYDPRAVFYHEHSVTVDRTQGAGWADRVKLRNRYLMTWKNLGDCPLLARSLRSWFFDLRSTLKPEHRWKRKPLIEALARLPKALGRRFRLPAATIPDREILPELLPGRIRSGLGRATPYPGDLWDFPPTRPEE